jgi:tRNA A-37 threonylcarbamoyl transferase component Bud32/outer membrane protein assembly factor BamB
MTDPNAATIAPSPPDSASALVRVLDDYVAALNAGQPLDRGRLLEQYPDLAGQLESCLAALDFIHRADQPTGQAPARLGDFRIIREVGRGGMGVVYEAEQISLKRRVALKVLRFGGTADEAALARFQREAETVARLHHTNIVPVFAVGCEQGVHYFAMQYIEGHGLDKVSGREKIAFGQLARWGVQASEALAHAHARGVIHRDIKPSNLLLDAEGVVWLTDFGLARRADEMTLTVTGLLLGTPRYMSPEQANAAQRPVDERSNIYSLGATLYELATGAPVHDGDTPQRLIMQILEVEPVLPSRHRPEMPRDLETILLKCLAKEPQRRYGSAQELADDLRRFASGDAIKARRPSLRERAARWLRRYRSSTMLGAGAAVASVLVVTALLTLTQRVEHWLQGRLYLATDGPTLSAQVLTLDGRPAYPGFTVPTEEPLALQAGDYLLRLRGRGFLDETCQVRLERGFERAFDVSLSDQRQWDPIAVPRCYDLAALDGRTDMLVLSAAGVTRRHGGTGEVLWTAVLDAKAHPALAGFRWDWDTRASPSGRGNLDRRPRLLEPGPDLDDDGTPDLVWTSSRQAALVALSGKDGRVLWCWQAAPPKLPPNSGFNAEHASTGIVLGPPAVVDVDNDGRPDLIVTCAQQAGADGAVPRWVEALSGRTGKSLWRFDLDGRWFAPPPGSTVPDAGLWLNTIGIASGSASGIRSMPQLLYNKDFMLSGSGLPVPYPAVMARLGKRDVLTVVAGAHLVTLDSHTGRPIGPVHDLGFWPIRTPQLVDLVGDGKARMLLLGPSAPAQNPPDNPPAVGFVPDGPRVVQPPQLNLPGIAHPPDDDRLTLSAVDLGTGKALWHQTLRAYWGWNWFQHPFDWPVVADLDADRRPEIVVPTGDFAGDGKWSGIEVRDGSTGAVRWRKKLMRGTRFGELFQFNRILVGPDVDGDGVRDVFTAVLDGREFSADQPYTSFHVLNFDKDYNKPVLRVDALSGKDGKSLWWVSEPLHHGALSNMPRPTVGPLQWWHADPDGWPQLVVPYEHEPHGLYVFSAGSGQRLRVGSELYDVRLADLDGNGVPALLSFHADRPRVYDRGGQLVAVRGQSAIAWRRQGGYWQAMADLDGDGVVDLVTAPAPDAPIFEDKPRRRDAAARLKDTTDRPMTRAVSGRDGRILWSTEVSEGRPTANWEPSRHQRIVPAGADLDGDGIADLLATVHQGYMMGMGRTMPPVVAVSGRTGRRLWTADIQVSHLPSVPLLECHDLSGAGRPDVVCVTASDWGWQRGANEGVSSNDWQYWLAVLDKATGKVKWKQPLSERNTAHINSSPARSRFSFAVADLDGDGAPDIVIEGGLPERDGEVLAFRGSDGEPLWTWKPAARKLISPANRPTFTVGDLAGRRVVVVLHVITKADAKGMDRPHAEVLALDAHTGKPLWSWQRVVGYQHYNDSTNGAVLSRVVPQIVQLGGGRQGVCVWTESHVEKARVFQLDEQGRELRARAVDFRLDEQGRQRQRKDPQINYSPVYGPHFRVSCRDLDGDGRDELIVITNNRVQVLTGDLAAVRWEWSLPDAECSVLDVYPANEAQPATVVVRAGDRVVGLAGPDGRLLWTCTGAGKPLAVLPASGHGELPRVVFDLGEQATVCRNAQPPGEARAVVPYTPSDVEDPRFVRPLPWNAITDRPPLFPASPWGIALTLAGLAVAVIVVPGWLWWRALRGRRWWLALVPLIWLTLVWSAITVLYFVELNDDAAFRVAVGGWWSVIWDLGLRTVKLAPLGLPLVAFAVALRQCCRRQPWVRLLTVTLLVAVLAAVFGWVWVQQAAGTLDDDQQFSRHGWFGIVPAGVYAVGVLAMAWWVMAVTVRLARRAWRKVARHPLAA